MFVDLPSLLDLLRRHQRSPHVYWPNTATARVVDDIIDFPHRSEAMRRKALADLVRAVRDARRAARRRSKTDNNRVAVNKLDAAENLIVKAHGRLSKPQRARSPKPLADYTDHVVAALVDANKRGPWAVASLDYKDSGRLDELVAAGYAVQVARDGSTLHARLLDIAARKVRRALTPGKRADDAPPSARTSIRRSTLSATAREAIRRGLVTKGATVLDFGAGDGDDVRQLQAKGYDAVGWDPHRDPQGERRLSDVVLVTNVLNVLRPTPRREALRDAMSLSRRAVVIGTPKYSPKGIREEDGVVTSAGTFQANLSPSAIVQLARRAGPAWTVTSRGQVVVMVAPEPGWQPSPAWGEEIFRPVDAEAVGLIVPGSPVKGGGKRGVLKWWIRIDDKKTGAKRIRGLVGFGGEEQFLDEEQIRPIGAARKTTKAKKGPRRPRGLPDGWNVHKAHPEAAVTVYTHPSGRARIHDSHKPGADRYVVLEATADDLVPIRDHSNLASAVEQAERLARPKQPTPAPAGRKKREARPPRPRAKSKPRPGGTPRQRELLALVPGAVVDVAAIRRAGCYRGDGMARRMLAGMEAAGLVARDGDVWRKAAPAQVCTLRGPDRRAPDRDREPWAGDIGPAGVVYDAEGRPYPIRWRALPLATVVASHTPDGRRVPDYPAELQARDRGAATSVQQVKQIAAALDPHRLIAPSTSATDSSPIVWPDADGSRWWVVSGNGRRMALGMIDASTRRAYLDAVRSTFTGIEVPRGGIVVRELVGQAYEEAVQLAGASQAAAVAAMSTLEQARSVARGLGITSPADLHRLGPVTWTQPLRADTWADFAARNPRWSTALLALLDPGRRPTVAGDAYTAAALAVDVMIGALPDRAIAGGLGDRAAEDALRGAVPGLWTIESLIQQERSISTQPVDARWSLLAVLHEARALYERVGSKAIARLVRDIARDADQLAIDTGDGLPSLGNLSRLGVALGVALLRSGRQKDPVEAAAGRVADFIAEARRDAESAGDFFSQPIDPADVLARLARWRDPRPKANPRSDAESTWRASLPLELRRRPIASFIDIGTREPPTPADRRDGRVHVWWSPQLVGDELRGPVATLVRADGKAEVIAEGGRAGETDRTAHTFAHRHGMRISHP